MIRDNENRSQIVISDDRHGLPFSKGLIATSLTATGLSPSRSHKIARIIEQHLIESGRFSIGVEELRQVVYEQLLSHEGKGYADTYKRWQTLLHIDRPMIILIGGTTGVGKSTIATTLAHRLGITHIVATDALREVMRIVLSEELIPALHESTFLAYKAINRPIEGDPLVAGFREQTKVVAVGVRAVVDRAIKEGLNMVIEGVHVVPGFIRSQLSEKAIIIPLIITVDNEELHRSHFYVRDVQTEGSRPYERYRDNFESIRRIGDYIVDLAHEYDIPILTSHSLDKTIIAAQEVVLNRVLGPVEEAVKGSLDEEPED
ncbi:MAG TPA: 2-phosphoglycerate kinase [Actinobacteria bacterium]|nr:2-phosphoglycerate kinase [Actinomycetota bacterium]